MAVFRYQVTCVGFWRGKVKRWNTTFHSTQNSNTVNIYNLMQSSGYKPTGDVVGACSGGVASIAVYNATGGAPISRTIYFDWQAPGSWIPYTGTFWSNVDPDTPLDASGESALVVVGNMAALSSAGKPVTTRRYLHAIPSRTSTDYNDPDVDATTQAAFETAWGGGWLRNPAGVSPATVTCEPYYLNHQRVRGRRRSTAQVAANAFAGGVAIGAGSAGGVAPLIA